MEPISAPLNMVLRVGLPPNPAETSSVWLPRLIVALSIFKDPSKLATHLGLPFVVPESWTVVYAQEASSQERSMIFHGTLMSLTYAQLTSQDNNVEVYFEELCDIEAVSEGRQLTLFTLSLSDAVQKTSDDAPEILTISPRWATVKSGTLVQTKNFLPILEAE